jgi:ATP-dependent helicase/DNAse subunit B
LGLLKSLESGGAEDGIALSRLVELLDELCAPDAARHPFAPGELSDLLRDALSSTYLPVPNYSGVQITDLGASGGAPCDYLFLGGLVQGEFPRLTPGDIFIDETQRQHLGLDERAETETERLLFYQTVCTPRRGLYILYPQRSGTEILSPSPFVEELDNLLTERPATADDDTPFTAADLHFALGRGLGRASDSAEASRALELYRRAASHPSHRPALRRLLRGLQVTCQRSHPAGLGPYEGVLDESEVLAGLRSRLGPGHAFSTTQLETYGRCPFRFFAKRLLGIEALVDPEADYTALERGNLVHRILYHFYAANGEAAEREENLPQGLVQLRRIAREQAADMRLEGFFWERELDRLLGAADGLGREGVLTRFLRLRVASADPAVPAHFELSFGSYPGLGPRDPHSTNTPYIIGDAESGDEVRIFGKIDRVDRTADGRFIVFDYKTGRQPRVAEIKEGLNLQLPLYLLAVETLLGEAGLNEGAGAAYLLLRDLENCGRRGLLANASHRDTAYVARGRQGLYDHEDFRQLLDAVRGYVLRYARAMRAGIFHVTRHNPATTCSGCPYAQSCRLDPRRMRILDRENQLP